MVSVNSEMKNQSARDMKELYEEDYVLWLDETAKQLHRQDKEQLDWKHLAEEIEGLGNEQRHKIDSYLLQLLIHLLLYQYWESKREWCRDGWEDEIGNFRVQLEFLFESQTLYNYCLRRIDTVYPKARKRVIKKTKLSASTFPEQCPFTFEQIIDFEFLPE